MTNTISLNELHKELKDIVESQRGDLVLLSTGIHSQPESGFHEEHAVCLITGYLKKHGFTIETGVGGLKTAFTASYGSGSPLIAILAEYDALPGLGHACGHNIIAASAAGAAVAAKRAVSLSGGTIRLIGTPGEEVFGGKAIMVEEGVFSDVDAAMMVHPGSRNRVLIEALSCVTLDIEFFGREAHAAANPEQGINALDAMILAYTGINSLRQHLRDKSRVHGIITAGGEAANVVPGYSAAKFMVRCEYMEYFEELKQKVLDCFHAAAMATGARLEYRWGDVVYAPMNNNRRLARVFYDNFRGIRSPIEPFDETGRIGSTDMGNVSQVVPSIHPIVAIVPPGISLHTEEFARAAVSDAGHQGLIDGACVLAMTASDLFYDPSLLRTIKEEFNRSV